MLGRLKQLDFSLLFSHFSLKSICNDFEHYATLRGELIEMFGNLCSVYKTLSFMVMCLIAHIPWFYLFLMGTA